MYLRLLNRITLKSCFVGNFNKLTYGCAYYSTKLNIFTLNKSQTNFIQKRTLRGGDGYSEFGHGRNVGHPVSKYGKFYQTLLLIVIPSLVVAYSIYDEYINPKSDSNRDKTAGWSEKSVKAASIDSDDKSWDSIDINEDQKDSNEKDDDEENNKKKLSFKERKIIAYENRIRKYSTPDKIFRYFATLKVLSEDTGDYEIFMTPDDFVRSLTYGAKQPDNLGLDSYQVYDPNVCQLNFNLNENNVFNRLGQNGLISFSDYLFLITLLSTPTRHFEIAFKMMDLDGSGNVDIEEFEQLQLIIRNNTQMGKKHRDTRMTGSVIKENSALINYFFGDDKKELLTVEKFIDFQKSLQKEMIKIEFESYGPVEGKISDKNFCEMLLAYAGFEDAKTKKILKRISKTFKENQDGISSKDYEDFFHVLRSIQDIDTALKFYKLAGASIDKNILKHVAKTVANVDLGDHVVDVVFCLFDENGDGKLSHQEFVSVMKKRWLRGLQNPKDTGFVRLLNAFVHCTKETVVNSYF